MIVALIVDADRADTARARHQAAARPGELVAAARSCGCPGTGHPKAAVPALRRPQPCRYLPDPDSPIGVMARPASVGAAQQADRDPGRCC